MSYEALRAADRQITGALENYIFDIDRIVENAHDSTDDEIDAMIAPIQAQMTALYAQQEGIRQAMVRDYSDDLEHDRIDRAERRHEELMLGNHDYL
jgi:hypothetical protein